MAGDVCGPRMLDFAGVNHLAPRNGGAAAGRTLAVAVDGDAFAHRIRNSEDFDVNHDVALISLQHRVCTELEKSK